MKSVATTLIISIPFVNLRKGLRLHPMFMIVKEKMLITWRDERSSKSIEAVVKTLEDCATEGEKADPSFIVSRLFSEVADENSKVMVSLRELIDGVEGEALEKPWRKAVTRSVFGLKKGISTLHRLLWVEKELMSDVKEGTVPHIRLTKEAKLIMDDAIDDIDRELGFIDSYGRTLDAVLRLQDLGLIHRVERTLIHLTAIILLTNIILIILALMK